MKKFLVAVLAAITVAACALGGCVTLDGRGGLDGHNLSIYDVYEATNAARREKGEEELDFLDFIREYFNYSGGELSQAAGLQAVINRSLLSTVSIVSGFKHFNVWSDPDPDYYAGSGVIVDIDKTAGEAYILTNCHVIYSDDSSYASSIASEIYVYLYGNETFVYGRENSYSIDLGIEAEVVGASITYDLALLKITDGNLSNYYAATFTESDEVYVGQTVYAVGNPEGEGLSASVGIISRDSEVIPLTLSDKSYPSYDDYNDYRVIRTDAAINGGNSGGGLYDTSGRLLGIVNSKTVGEDIENMGYVLCGSYAKRICKLFMDGYGKSNDTYLERAVFRAKFSYSSKVWFDPDDNVTKIDDRVKIISASGVLEADDVLQKIRILDGERVVEDAAITRYYLVNDILLSARTGYTIEYTVERDGVPTVVTESATMTQCK